MLHPSRSMQTADGNAMFVQCPPHMSGIKRSARGAQEWVGNAASLVTAELRGTGRAAVVASEGHKVVDPCVVEALLPGHKVSAHGSKPQELPARHCSGLIGEGKVQGFDASLLLTRLHRVACNVTLPREELPACAKGADRAAVQPPQHIVHDHRCGEQDSGIAGGRTGSSSKQAHSQMKKIDSKSPEHSIGGRLREGVSTHMRQDRKLRMTRPP